MKLVAKSGSLYFPHGGVSPTLHRCADIPSLLIYHYHAGDVDTIPWPLKSSTRTVADLRHQLAVALYGERECNDCFPADLCVVELPDGKAFNF